MNLRLLLPAIVSLLLWNSAWSAEDYQTPRTEWNQPDLQGVWNFSSDIPMQRPAQYGEREFLTEEEVAEIRARRVARDDFSDAAIPNGGVNEAYNDFWVETAGIGDVARTSIIVYPENGRLPPYAEGAVVVQGRLDPDIDGERPVRFTGGGIGSDGPEDRGLGERCIVGFNAGPPISPSLYNNNLQIVQSRDHVVIMIEMVHDARIVPLDGRGPLDDSIRLWSGDSRGYWDGETLVVESRNFNGLTQSFGAGGTSDTKFLIERFTRLSDDSIAYEFTVDDPQAYTDKITGIIPLTKVDGLLYEYACHEGNYGLLNILRGARAEEARATESAR
ncbi:MAG: hypothetical protein HN872_02310 [Gammaproteobacteria bacterium]|jgi:hypothetical protein|nr:hypothetical protein [Pseudomonadales bacterium]MBT5719214.1 hypothetical protein [Gammaproteobacteria bacterium]MBT7225423.1 hypothetical protein [Gammaproteobacteria bacterium]